MGADVSRVRFDPRDDFSGVVLQQGRLLLDADFNEYVAVLDRRLRAETCDLTSFGSDPDQAGVAWVPRQTPNGFRITAAGGELSIGRGRMYVDGLLAENHGLAPAGFDPLLSEPTGTTDTPYLGQPWWPTPDPLPPAGPHLVYLDVWQRELTHVEAPELVEVAVGVDTAARLQTVWQVRVLPNVGTTTTCESDDDQIPGWLDVIAPSAGRLTTGTVEVAPAADPCELPPTGGYRGLENQTYRVEVHDGGPPGTATFKWSRDNASVTLPVAEMVNTTLLRLASVGKDDVLRVSTGDWVEILDDHYELGQRPGVVRRVTVDDAASTIAFTGPIPADLRPADATDAAERHLRVRRWDQSGVVRSGAGAVLVNLDQPGSTGLITVPAGPATQVVLEHGIAVSFSLVPGGSGDLRAGDHWIFAARTADTSLEVLQAAPPRGVHHHYARLAVVTFPGSAASCRRLWPPEAAGGDTCGECTVCVTPESHESGALTVQGAVDLVRVTGGTVCLAAGVYDVGAGVTLEEARSVRITGQGLATVVSARGTAFAIARSGGVTVEDMAVVSGVAAPAAIRLRTVVSTEVRRVSVLSYGSDEGGGSAVEVSGAVLLLTLRDNVLVGPTGVSGGARGDENGVLAAVLRIEDNVVGAGERGIDLGGRAAYLYSCRVAGNHVLAGAGGGIMATGAVAPGGSLDVVGNKVSTDGAGITVGTDALVESNRVDGMFTDGGTEGIVVDGGDVAAAPGHVRVTGNRVHDRSGAGIVLRTAVRTFMVKQNVLSSVGSGISMEGKGSADHVAVENNQVLEVGPGDEGRLPAVGVVVTRAGSAAVVGNTVAGVGRQLVAGQMRAGIMVMGSADVRVSGNVVDEVGPPDQFVGLAVGLIVMGPFDHLAVAENSVGSGLGDEAQPDGRWLAVLVQSAGEDVNRVGGGRAVVNTGGGGALVLTRDWAYVAPPRGDAVRLTANALTGGGRLPTCRVRVSGDVVADANQVTHRQPGDFVGMVLGGSSLTASSNRVAGPRAMLVLEVGPERFAALGNVTAGGTHVGGPGGGLPDPWPPFNPTVA